MTFRKAERKRAKARIGISGPSGSGKTYSAILLAKGFGGKIAMVDTEHGSGELYSNLTDYDVATMSPPFDPDRFIEMIQKAEKEGYSTLIFDTLSHPWFASGGLLELHDQLSTNPKENTYTAWREPTKKHNRLIEAIHQSNVHIISTFRSKQDYLIQTDERGKMKPVKVGLAPIQRDGIEYEYTIFFDLTPEHRATASKDRTGLFDGQPPFLISPDTGKSLLAWLDSGEAAPLGQLSQEEAAQIQVELDKQKAKIAASPDKREQVRQWILQLANNDSDVAVGLLKTFLAKAGKEIPAKLKMSTLPETSVNAIYEYVKEAFERGSAP